MSLASIRPHSPAQQHRTPYIAKSTLHPVVHLVGTGDVVLVVDSRSLGRPTPQPTTLDLFLPTSGDRPFYGAMVMVIYSLTMAMVERCDGPSWLRDDDDDEAGRTRDVGYWYFAVAVMLLPVSG